MKLEKIITIANESVRLQFVAMERSLRATGCTLPLWVIPFDDRTFDLPENAQWLCVDELMPLLRKFGSTKYQVFSEKNYQFADTDICFVRNPESVMLPHSGLVVADVQMFAWQWAVTRRSRIFLDSQSTTWRASIFNAGQFACDKGYSVAELSEFLRNDAVMKDCLVFGWHDQPGVNYLVAKSRWKITNLIRAPYSMQSTWANDYFGCENFKEHWRSEEITPYLIHWAGVDIDGARPIDSLYLEFLTHAERQELKEQILAKQRRKSGLKHKLEKGSRRIKDALEILVRGHDRLQCVKMDVRNSMNAWTAHLDF